MIKQQAASSHELLVCSPVEKQRRRSVFQRTALTVLITGCAIAFFMLLFIQADWSYTMQLRGHQVGALVVAGTCIGISSVIFQTLTGNRLLTPGIMGFDSLYVLIQTIIVFSFGANTLLLMAPGQRAVINMVCLSAFGVFLFRALFRRLSRNLLVMVLVGVVLSGLFGSLTSLASRMLSPSDYLTLQDVMFASFNTVNHQVLYVTATVTIVLLFFSFTLRRSLDVIALGHQAATSLGVNFHRTVTWSLLVITLMVAASTALVGPMTFLGLLVANVARQLVSSSSHHILIPLAACCGVIATVAGQMVVAHLFDHTTTLSVVVNLVGGCYFLLLVWREIKS